jgi:hypothetical protein
MGKNPNFPQNLRLKFPHLRDKKSEPYTFPLIAVQTALPEKVVNPVWVVARPKRQQCT